MCLLLCLVSTLPSLYTIGTVSEVSGIQPGIESMWAGATHWCRQPVEGVLWSREAAGVAGMRLVNAW